MASIVSINFLDQSQSGNIDFDADTLKVIIMKTGFVFNEDLYANYSDVSAFELSNGNGYTTGGITWTSVVVTPDIANNRSAVTGDNPSWDASGGPIGPSPSVIIIKDTGTPSSSTVIGNVTFTNDEQLAGDGSPFTVTGITVYYNAV